jgi:putative heme iron utilization protein
MKKIKLFEEFLNESSTWEKLTAKSEKVFGELAIDSLTEDDMAKIINLKEADKLAKKKFGEFGFATLSTDEMKELINKYPNLVI